MKMRLQWAPNTGDEGNKGPKKNTETVKKKEELS